MNKREMLANVYGPDVLDEVVFLEPEYLDEAIMGLGQNDKTTALVYSEPCVIRLLKQNENMSHDVAVEYLNTEIWEQDGPIFVDNEVFE